ncbi:MAG: hypothetical protein R2695_13325 [Acidimicrobiales bacterium]
MLLDAIWLDRIIGHVLERDLGSTTRWCVLAKLHPLAADSAVLGRAAVTPESLRGRRLGLRVGWAGFRARATSPGAPWPGMSPAIASWLDDGSFARWVLTDLPPIGPVLADLGELLEASVVSDIHEALAAPT